MNEQNILDEIKGFFSSYRYQQDQIDVALLMMTAGYKGSFVRARLRECIKFKNINEEQEFLDFFLSRKLIYPRGERWFNLTPKCKKILKSYLALKEVRQHDHSVAI